MSERAIEALKDTSKTPGTEVGLDEKHAAVAAYTDSMTKGCIVKDAVFERVKGLFSEREVVEITVSVVACFGLGGVVPLTLRFQATISAYNCVSRFLVALDVGEMASKYGIPLE